MTGRRPDDPARMEHELRESKRIIEDRLPGHRVEHLCYPFGQGSEEAVRLSKEAGYKTNFWSGRLDRSLNRRGADPFHIVRLKHDYIRRLPGAGREGLLPIVADKFMRRLKGGAFA